MPSGSAPTRILPSACSASASDVAGRLKVTAATPSSSKLVSGVPSGLSRATVAPLVPPPVARTTSRPLEGDILVALVPNSGAEGHARPLVPKLESGVPSGSEARDVRTVADGVLVDSPRSGSCRPPEWPPPGRSHFPPARRRGARVAERRVGQPVQAEATSTWRSWPYRPGPRQRPCRRAATATSQPKSAPPYSSVSTPVVAGAPESRGSVGIGEHVTTSARPSGRVVRGGHDRCRRAAARAPRASSPSGRLGKPAWSRTCWRGPRSRGGARTRTSRRSGRRPPAPGRRCARPGRTRTVRALGRSRCPSRR